VPFSPIQAFCTAPVPGVTCSDEGAIVVVNSLVVIKELRQFNVAGAEVILGVRRDSPPHGLCVHSLAVVIDPKLTALDVETKPRLAITAAFMGVVKEHLWKGAPRVDAGLGGRCEALK
jgi:hypothetical protein